jgi:hypothetical protein
MTLVSTQYLTNRHATLLIPELGEIIADSEKWSLLKMFG